MCNDVINRIFQQISNSLHNYLVSGSFLHSTACSLSTGRLKGQVASFLRVTAGTAIAHLSHRNSVRVSVHPSHGWISQKRCKLRSPNLHYRLPGRL